jgi:hypothetical protein
MKEFILVADALSVSQTPTFLVVKVSLHPHSRTHHNSQMSSRTSASGSWIMESAYSAKQRKENSWNDHTCSKEQTKKKIDEGCKLGNHKLRTSQQSTLLKKGWWV